MADSKSSNFSHSLESPMAGSKAANSNIHLIGKSISDLNLSCDEGNPPQHPEQIHQTDSRNMYETPEQIELQHRDIPKIHLSLGILSTNSTNTNKERNNSNQHKINQQVNQNDRIDQLDQSCNERNVKVSQADNFASTKPTASSGTCKESSQSSIRLAKQTILLPLSPQLLLAHVKNLLSLLVPTQKPVPLQGGSVAFVPSTVY
eukprot:CAMPEP_0183745396 /NCGR_PEP_ID=MMETSP0737-20130205/66221_1 /TAXON_ID=385413 /ORGANISM="Thalassiosira miniscula, Strain CCMP1093" /LENGTH=203 /DNA_ID=CAMNT_0025981063 /DNA_START=6 /DNA_END=617 /DNA_ORIENTATION=-